MESVTTPFGRRPMTLGMIASQVQGRRIEPGQTADKWKLFRALCEARLRLGVTDRALALMNALLSFYPKPSLSAEDGLVVFPSNAQLSLRANGMAEATIRRHLAVLVEAGLLSRKDSANGKRYARRNGEGALDEAFGFSLAPLLARAEEIERLAADVVAERLAMQRLREKLTIARRDAAKLIETGLGEGIAADWDGLQLRYHDILAALPRKPTAANIADALDAMQQLCRALTNLLETRCISENMNAIPSQNERHIQNSKPDSLYESERHGKEILEEMAAPEQKGAAEPPKVFPLGFVLSACPDIADYGPGGAIASWRDLMGAAVVVRSMLGVSPSAYQAACEVMGPENAAITMACILDRAGEIQSAGGYLRDLTRRAERGEFSLGPMLMAALRNRGGTVRRAG